MKPLQKDQVPKVIAIGVVATGLLGYCAFSWLGGGGGAPAVAATPPAGPAVPPVPEVGPKATIPALQLAEIHHEDPFKPAFGPTLAPPPAPPKPPAPVKPMVEARAPAPPPVLQDTFTGPPMDALPALVKVSEVTGPATARVEPPAPKPEAPRPAPPAAKPAPPAAPPPAVVITGILEGDDNVAILKWDDSHRQVVRVGDKLDGGYVVKAIRSDAVVVAHRTTTWTIRLGGDKPVAN
jgi:hypothetical protein